MGLFFISRLYKTDFLKLNKPCKQLLQLCDAGASSSYGAAYCRWLDGGCQGSYNTNCHPAWVWSSKTSSTSSGEYWGVGLESGSLVDNSKAYIGTYPYSVRCVLDLVLLFIKLKRKINSDQRYSKEALRLWRKLFLRRCKV